MWRNRTFSTMQKRKLQALEFFCYLVLFIVALVMLARATTAHDMYGSWQTNYGGSCCNNQDCHPTDARRVGDHWEVPINGVWHKVPEDAVIRKNSPDGQAHVCNIGETIICFVEPVLA